MRKQFVLAAAVAGFSLLVFAAEETTTVTTAADTDNETSISLSGDGSGEQIKEALQETSNASEVLQGLEGESPAQPIELDPEELIAICVACHGEDGKGGPVDAYPKLAGQHASYLLKQMQEIKNGTREVAEMTGMLDALNAEQINVIAEYLAAQEPTLNQAKEQDLALGAKIYRLGNIEKGLPACSGCHSPRGEGNAPAVFPALGGQHAAYIVSTLKAFRKAAEYPNEGRSNDPMQGVMRDIALRMSDKEIEAVANYISGLY